MNVDDGPASRGGASAGGHDLPVTDAEYASTESQP
jgi:hypothetical protein